MNYIWDKENRILLINGKYKEGLWTGISVRITHNAKRIIQVCIDQDKNKRVFNNIKNISGKTGEFIPTREEFNYIFEQLIGS